MERFFRHLTAGESLFRPFGGAILRSIAILSVAVLAVALFVFTDSHAQGTLRLKSGFVNTEYPAFSFNSVVSGVSPSAQWEVKDPTTLPTGLTLDYDGTLHGIPVVSRTTPFEFEVRAKEQGNVVFSVNVSLQIVPPGVDPDKINNLQTASFTPATPTAPPTCKPTPSSFVLFKATADEETIGLTEDVDFKFENILNPNTLEILNIDELIRNTLTKTPPPMGPTHAVPSRGDYCVVHIVKWKPIKGDQEKSDPEKELWALFEKVDRVRRNGTVQEWAPHIDPTDPDGKNFDTRIFGSRRVALLLLHLQTPRSWDIKYKVTINQRTPEPVQNLLDMAAFLGGAGQDECQPASVRDIWGGRMMQFRYIASDMVVKLNTVTSNDGGNQVGQSKEYSKSYVNEGRYHWDVSFGLPVKSIKELEFSTEANGSGSVVTVRKKERQNAYGFLNVFPKAVDLSGRSYLTSPHFVFGVPISGKPLDRPIVGIGTGLYTDKLKVNFFAGIAFNKVREPRTLTVGEAATTNQLENDLQSRRVKKFVFGVNFPVKQFIKAIKGQ